MSRRSTIYDVARVAGVSVGTVSRVLNGHPVGAASRAAVQRALVSTGYVANQHARRLAGARPATVAFLHCVPGDRLLADANVNTLQLDCRRALGDEDIMMVTPVAGGGPSDTAVRALAARLDDPVLVFSAPRDSTAVADLAGRGVPVVSCGVPLGHERRVSYVTTDDRDGAQQIVSYLRSRGRRRIATITGPMDLPGGVQRLAGYRDAVGTFDPALVVPGDYTFEGGLAATRQLLRQAPDLDAIFAASDTMAAGALAACEQAGRQVPGDVAVAGFDDAKIATQTRLTTVRIPWHRYAAQLTIQLLRRMAGDEPSGVVMPVDLVIRASA
ncbi:LacI family DNA-binding transcriptional regulator [Actinoplanes couchii]|uniref:Transcriptional regulator n=1 Tax=Actinoplanes couchii TaxID=403638 RepID=A0ABQ3XLK4_9ACTN|nr:LacI family DNA-binding transcriptional regulator [Actinoplanes couchii]MDR6318247.1 DNA-binding LacI/PurR family transcriptional regulator [Actinoplanes couchii]GID59382.1 transcriptional regulator [Actinoplanes couchii]